ITFVFALRVTSPVIGALWTALLLLLLLLLLPLLVFHVAGRVHQRQFLLLGNSWPLDGQRERLGHFCLLLFVAVLVFLVVHLLVFLVVLLSLLRLPFLVVLLP